MGFALTYLYLVAFLVGVMATAALLFASEPFAVKRTMVGFTAASALWALSDFLCNVSTSAQQMRVVALVAAPAWSVVPWLVLRAALIDSGRAEACRISRLGLVLLAPALGCVALVWSGWLQPVMAPPTAARGFFLVRSSAWQMAVNAYFVLYTAAAAVVLLRARRRTGRRRYDGPVRLLLGASLPAVLLGGAFNGGASVVGLDTPFIGSLLLNLLAGYAAAQTLLQGYFAPVATFRRQRDAARDAAGRMQAVLDRLPLGVCILRQQSLELLLCNERLARMVPGSIEATLEDAVAGLEDGSCLPCHELELEHADGEVCTLQLHCVPMTFVGEPAVLVTAADVSQQRRLERRLRDAQKLEAVGCLASGVAHEMNNILAVVLSCTEVLRLDLHPGSQLGQVLEDIIRATHQGREVTRGLLAYARRGPRVVEPLDFNRAVDEAVALLRRSAPDEISFQLELAPELPRVQGDAAQLRQVVMNLGLNAIDAMGGAGRLELRTREEPQAVVLTVVDHGCDMDPETLVRCQEPLFTTKRTGVGTGLGLAMVSGAVASHGGALHITSKPGRGTQVTVRLPTTVAASGTSAGPSEDRGPVLVVERDPHVRAAAVRLLQSLGYQASAVDGCDAALAALDQATQPFSAVLLDLMLPGDAGPRPGDAGPRPWQRIRTLAPDTPVILACGAAEQELAQELLEHQRWTVVEKPFDAESLDIAIQRAGEQRAG